MKCGRPHSGGGGGRGGQIKKASFCVDVINGWSLFRHPGSYFSPWWGILKSQVVRFIVVIGILASHTCHTLHCDYLSWHHIYRSFFSFCLGFLGIPRVVRCTVVSYPEISNQLFYCSIVVGYPRAFHMSYITLLCLSRLPRSHFSPCRGILAIRLY